MSDIEARRIEREKLFRLELADMINDDCENWIDKCARCRRNMENKYGIYSCVVEEIRKLRK